MIDFELTETDRQILDLARKQGRTYREHAKRLDRKMSFGPGHRQQFEVPGEQDFVHLRRLAQERADRTSGTVILDALIYLEETYAGKPLYWRGRGADSFDVDLGHRLLSAIGSPEQKARWQDKLLVWGMSEPGAGSDPAAMRTTAVLDAARDEWVINGEKTFITLGETADGVIVMCRCTGPRGDEGICPIVVEKGTAGFSVGPQMKKLGLNNWDTVSLGFMDCRVPAANRILGNLKNALSVYNGTRATIAAAALGHARIALDAVRTQLREAGIGIDYSAGVADRPAAVDRLIRLEALWEATYLTMLQAKWREQTYGPDKFYPSVAKLKGGLMARKIIGECLSILGPASVSVAFPLEQAFRDARIQDIYEGPSEIQRLILGRALLGYSAAELN
jgi:acyl-CoA dehydrogenase